jgi:hypothetical protein
MSQLTRIEQILLKEGKIDNFFAINTRLTIRLAMHINLLRAKKGYTIRTEEGPDKNCIYHLVAVPKTQLSDFI